MAQVCFPGLELPFQRSDFCTMPLAARQMRADLAGVRDTLDRRGVNRNNCIGGVSVALGVIVGIVFGAMSFLGACYTDPTCPGGEEESVQCNCGKFGTVMTAVLLLFGIAILLFERKTGEGARDVELARPRLVDT